jgi:tryptophan synthase alpha chain
MDRIAKAFQQKKPYIGYLTGGDGGLEYSVDCALALIDGGVDILEIGLPFSDPVADGPVIEKAHERALAAGTTSATILEMAKRLRQVTDIPLVLFSYYNPILQKGEQFLHDLKSVGFDAVLIVDLAVPLNVNIQEPFFDSLLKADLLPILLATPSTDDERLEQISKIAKGFLYYVSQKGTTGVRSSLANDFASQISRLRKYFNIPIAAGFGIADKASARKALEHSDGFIVGSALVKKMEEKIGSKELAEYTKTINPR